MSETTAPEGETRQLQTEVRQLLKLMIHSLYSNKEIFLRELISNAADACDKLRFETLQNPALQDDKELGIDIQVDADAGTLTISDNGIGMSRDEIIANLGTIARSGTREFLDKLSGDERKDAQLIGQFGVGFYSAFIVADEVTVDSMAAAGGEPVRWRSQGDGEYDLLPGQRQARGTTVTLHLREDEKEFLDNWRLQGVIKKYSDHIALPVRLVSTGDNDEVKVETVNDSSALWRRSRKDISNEQYEEFYRYIAHDAAAPLQWSHFHVEGRSEYTGLLYIPAKAPLDLYDPNRARGVKLFVQRVFIMDDAQKLLPNYLRFVRGVVDSADLPLNVSREILQNSRAIDTIRAGLVKKVLALLQSLAKNDAGKFATFIEQFGNVLKEGVVEDPGNREAISALLRFHSSHEQTEQPAVALADYVGRMPESQEAIHYLLADSLVLGRSSPHLEGPASRGEEVLLLTEPVDEWLVSHLFEFEGKPLRSVAHAEAAPEKEELESDELAGRYRDVAARMGSLLGEQVEDVRVSRSLVDSAARVLAPAGDPGEHIRRMLKDAGQELPESRNVLEINPTHPLIVRLSETTDKKRFAELTWLVHDLALLAHGDQLADPAAFVKRVNEALLRHEGAAAG